MAPPTQLAKKILNYIWHREKFWIEHSDIYGFSQDDIILNYKKIISISKNFKTLSKKNIHFIDAAMTYGAITNNFEIIKRSKNITYRSLAFACVYSSPEIINYLLEFKKFNNEEKLLLASSACRYGTIHSVEIILNKFKDINIFEKPFNYDSPYETIFKTNNFKKLEIIMKHPSFRVDII